MLTDVFAECVRTLEPGGRIAVNVANLGRKPYRSLSADVIRILEDDLGLLLRGELIWQKAEGASGSCAWGSFRSAANPVLRDITERVIVASKGRFDRARSAQAARAEGLPHESTMLTDDFLAPDARRLVDPARERPAGRPPGAVPRRASRAADPPLHVRATTSCSTRSWAAVRRSSRPPGSAGATSATTSTPITSRSPAGASTTCSLTPRGRADDHAADGGRPRSPRTRSTAAGFHVTGRKRRIAGSGVVVDLVADDAGGPAGFVPDRRRRTPAGAVD